MEPEEPVPILPLLTGFRLAVGAVLVEVPDDILLELSLDVDDLVKSTLLVVGEAKTEHFGDTAGFGITLLAPLATDTFGG